MEVVVVLVIILAVVGAIGLMSSLRVVKQYERGVIYRFGRVSALPKEPGPRMLVPFVDPPVPLSYDAQLRRLTITGSRLIGPQRGMALRAGQDVQQPLIDLHVSSCACSAVRAGGAATRCARCPAPRPGCP